MRRHNHPFNGKRFLLNINTGEIHDLDKETASCLIDNIKPEHIYMDDSYEAAHVYASMMGIYNSNGCHYCMPSKDNG